MSKKPSSVKTTKIFATVAKKRQPLLYVILAGVIVIIIGSILYVTISNALDRAKFMSLKEDMLALQVEFNKIQPGWEYSDGCRGGQEVFNGDDPNNCFLDLNNNLLAINNKDNFNKLNELVKTNNFVFDKLSDETFNGVDYLSYQYSHVDNKKIKCALSASSNNPGIYFGCSGKARDFYFQKID